MRVNGIKIEETDTVVTVTQHVSDQDEVFYRTPGGEEVIVSLQDIPQFHKIACRHMAKGEMAFKYGEPIGTAVQEIKVGAYVHTHNLRSSCMTLEGGYQDDTERLYQI